MANAEKNDYAARLRKAAQPYLSVKKVTRTSASAEENNVSQYASAEEAAAARAADDDSDYVARLRAAAQPYLPGVKGGKHTTTTTTSGYGISGKGSVTIGTQGRADYTAADIKALADGKIKNQSLSAVKDAVSEKAEIVPTSPLQQRINDEDQEIRRRIAEAEKKLEAMTRTRPVMSLEEPYIPKPGETPERLQQQIDTLRKQLNKTAMERQAETAGQMQREGIIKDFRNDISELPTAVRITDYLLGQYAAGVSAGSVGGFIGAVDAVLPDTDKQGNDITPSWLAHWKSTQNLYDDSMAVLGDTIPENWRRYGGSLAYGLGYSTPSMVMSILFPTAGVGATAKSGASLWQTIKNPSTWGTAVKTAAKNAATGMVNNLKNPQFWVSAIPMYGSGYAEAVAEGASEGEAQAFAILNAFAGATVEIGGGYQTIPQNKAGIWRWIKSALEEGREEVIQGVIQQLAEKVVYDGEKEWMSLTNADAVINPSRMLEEGAMGSVSGLLLGGGSTVVQAMSERGAYTAAATEFLSQTGGDMNAGVAAVWANTAPGTDVHTAAENMAKSIEAGKEPSMAAFGRLLLESQTEEAAQARERYVQTMDSAAALGVKEETAQAVGAVAARFGREIVFATEEELRSRGGNGQYSIQTLPDGKQFVKADRQVILGTDPNRWAEQVRSYIDTNIRHGRDIVIYAADGDPLTITRDTSGKARFRNDVRLPNGTTRPMTDNEYATKLRAETHIDELAAASTRGKQIVPDYKNHAFAKDGFDYRTAYFMDNDGQYYRLTISVGKNGAVNTIYNVGKTKEADFPLSGSKAASKNDATGSASNTKIPQNSIGVNSQFMQDGDDYTIAGEYDPNTGRITINAAATAQEAVDFIVKHELAHSVEGTKQWEQLADIVQAQMGDSEWSSALSDVMERYAAQNKQLDLPAAEREVVADWIGNNLYKTGFAQAIVKGDASVGNAFVQTIDRLRLALGNKKSRSHTNLAVVERLFMRALENEAGTGEGNIVYFIPKDKNEISIKEQLREHLDEINAMDPVADIQYNHIDKLTAKKAVSEEFKRLGYKVDRQGFGIIEIGEKEIETSAGYVNTPAECAAWIAVPKVLKRGKLIHTKDNHKARGHDTITIAAPVVINGTPGVLGIAVKETGKNRYKSHRILMPDGSVFVYENKKNAELTSAGMTAHKDGEGPTIGSASNTKIPQNSLGVNSQFMQDGMDYAENATENSVLQSTAEGADTATIHTAAAERAANSDTTPRTTAQGRTLEELAQELGDAELDRRMYMAFAGDELPATITADGREVDTAAYMAAVEEMLPNDRAGLEGFIRQAEAQLAQEAAEAYAKGDTESITSLPVNIQLFAAKRKLEMLLEPGEDGSETRRFFWQRTRGLDANETHKQELLDYLAGRSETYDPISDKTTMEKAERKLREPGYSEKLVKRLGRNKPDDLFNAVEMAAAQILINDARNDGDLELYADLVQGLSRKGTEAGRAVQILSIMARMTPEGTLKAAQRTFRKEVNRKYGEGASEAVDVLAGDVADAVERAAEEQKRTLPTFEEDTKFSQHIDQWETLNPHGYMDVGRIPAGSPLHQVGIPAGKLYFDVSKLKRSMGDHGDHLSTDILKKIPELLKNPIAIVEYKPGEGTNTVNIYGDLYYHGTPITVGIVVTLSPGGTVISKVRTVHARRDFAKQITDDSILYLGENKNETDTWFRTQGQRVPMSGIKYGFIRSIAHPFGDVKADMTREELIEGLAENIRQDNSPYITKEQILGIIERAVERATNIPAQMKKLLRSGEVKEALAKKIETVYKAGHLNDGTMRQAFEEALGLPTLSTEDVQTLIELVNKMQATEEGSAEQAEAQEAIYRFLGEKLPVTKLEAFQAWRKFAMLANPKTHIRNWASNGAMVQGINRMDTAFATLLERVLGVDDSARTAYIGWSHTPEGQALRPALEKAADKAVVKMKSNGGKYDISASRLSQYKKYFGTRRMGEALNKAAEWNSNLLEKGDVKPFRHAYTDALGQIMVARGMTEITAEVEALAYDRAIETIFRADNALNDVVISLKRYANKNTVFGKALGTAADIVIPFSKTPANIAKQSVLHSPIGVVKGAWDMVQAIQAGDGKAKASAINELAKGMTGTLLWAVGLLLGSLGMFNTGFGKTEKERAADELAGIQENSFQIGDVSVTLDWLQPAAAPLIVGASVAQRLKEDGLSLSSVFGAVMDGTDSLFELSMLQSLYDVLGGYDAGASASVGSAVENAVSQSIPTLLGQAARIIDPVARKTTGDNGFRTAVNQVLAKIPGLTYLLDPKLDVWGNEVYRTGRASAGSAALNVLQQSILPMNVKIATGDDEISRMVMALYENAEDRPSRAIPSVPDRDMAAELGVDYTALRKQVGKVNRQAVEDLMADRVAYTVERDNGYGKKKDRSLYWSDMTEDERLRVLNRIYAKTKQQIEEPKDDYFMDLIRRAENGN